ncbi:Centrosomal protein of 95 kDa [Fasciola gigantica]|uniref:Centrosomal protein of 95 kDa n=1 Tax=Fasciola gigantica TaxID=46835 RepID=A0A504YAP3_FASGI|nr:Centrosomal protein of 95 kDa [Fasciola gigantica]
MGLDEQVSIHDRLQSCINEVSKVIQVPLAHITSDDLMSFDQSAIGNFLEIIEFLVDYFCEEHIEDIHPPWKSIDSGSLGDYEEISDGPVAGPRSPLVPCEVANVAFKAEDLIQNSENSWTATSSTIHTTDCHGDNLGQRDRQDASLETDRITLASSKSIEDKSEDEARLKYLREKLLQCLSSLSADFPNSGNSSTDQSFKISDTSELSGTERGKHHSSPVCCALRSPTPCGLPAASGSYVRTEAQPLVPQNRTHTRQRLCPHSIQPISNSKRREPEFAHPAVLLDKVLEAFPLLDLSEHDRRVLRRKAVNSLGMFNPNDTGHRTKSSLNAPDRKLNWYEERQRRRLAQLIRHEYQVDRLRDLRASEAADRRIREEARDRHHQLVRARNYYRQFVHEFRARKLAKMSEEEAVFRRFFDCLLARERQNLLELQKMERDERHKTEQLREQAILGLEHSHRVRMALVNESIRREREEQTIRARHEQIEMIRQKRDIRRSLEVNIHEMQQALLSNQDSAYFRSADADRILRDTRYLLS